MEVEEQTVLIAAFVSGLVLYVIGSIMEPHENAERERRWRELSPDDKPRTRQPTTPPADR